MAPKHVQASRSDDDIKAHTPDQARRASRVSTARRQLVLPAFVARRQGPKLGESLQDYWAENETGDWERDVKTGSAHARDAIRFIREERVSHLLNWIAAEMIGKRRYGPLEVGFFHEIGALVLRTRR